MPAYARESQAGTQNGHRLHLGGMPQLMSLDPACLLGRDDCQTVGTAPTTVCLLHEQRSPTVSFRTRSPLSPWLTALPRHVGMRSPRNAWPNMADRYLKDQTMAPPHSDPCPQWEGPHHSHAVLLRKCEMRVDRAAAPLQQCEMCGQCLAYGTTTRSHRGAGLDAPNCQCHEGAEPCVFGVGNHPAPSSQNDVPYTWRV